MYRLSPTLSDLKCQSDSDAFLRNLEVGVPFWWRHARQIAGGTLNT